MRRRDLLLGGAVLALARPAAAAAAEGDVLDRLIAREDAAAFAYQESGSGEAARVASDHAKALRTALDALGRRGPSPPTTVRELDPAARRVAEDGTPASMIALQASLLEAYEQALAELSEPSILRTAATMAAANAQSLALLRRGAGLDPFR